MNLRNMKNNKLIITVITMILSIVIFAGSYFTSFFYNTYKENKELSSSVMNEKKDKEEEVLSDDMNIVFTRKTPDKNIFIDYKTTIKDYKKQINVEELTIDLLEKELSEKGFEKVSHNEKEVIFNRTQEVSSTALEPNKYYIGEKDGCVAMFRSDANGVATIEKVEDITFISVDNLPDRDREAIKSFTKKFDTREECEEQLSAYTS